MGISLLVVTLAICLISAAAVPAAEVKVIQFGWGSPSPEYVSRNIRKMEEIPFDGLHIPIEYDGDESEQELAWLLFEGKELDYAGLRRSVGLIRNTQFRRFTHNFSRINLSPNEPIDWFDDWSEVLSNVSLAARASREAGLRGFILDVETYAFPLFRYESQPGWRSRGFQQYQKQAERRGREFIRAIHAEFDDPVILLTFGYSLGARSVPLDKGLPEAGYGLLPSFLDGVLLGSTPATTLVDGYEFAYLHRRPEDFARARRRILVDSLSLTRYPDLYRQRIRVGFGLWLDPKGLGYEWEWKEVRHNHFTPAEFGRAVRAALHYADRYVWVYTETVNWWTGEKLHPAYLEALAEAVAEKGAEATAP